jgi:hypothetical protein
MDPLLAVGDATQGGGSSEVGSGPTQYDSLAVSSDPGGSMYRPDAVQTYRRPTCAGRAAAAAAGHRRAIRAASGGGGGSLCGTCCLVRTADRSACGPGRYAPRAVTGVPGPGLGSG